MRGGPDIRLIVEREEHRRRWMSGAPRERGVEPVHEFVLIHSGVRRIRSQRERLAFDRLADLETRRESVGSIGVCHRHAAIAIRCHIAQHRDRGHERLTLVERRLRAGAYRFARRAAAAQESVVGIDVVVACVAEVVLPVVCAQPVAAHPVERHLGRERLVVPAARIVDEIRAVDVARDRERARAIHRRRNIGADESDDRHRARLCDRGATHRRGDDAGGPCRGTSQCCAIRAVAGVERCGANRDATGAGTERERHCLTGADFVALRVARGDRRQTCSVHCNRIRNQRHRAGRC